MKCDCKQVFEEKLLERAKEKYPNSEDHTAELDGYALIVEDNRMALKPTMPILITHLHEQKNGVKKTKKVKSSMIFSYCPFCGVKINDDGEDNE